MGHSGWWALTKRTKYRGSTISKIVAENTREHPDLFEKDVQMWVYEEEVEYEGKTQKLSSIINSHHENIKYLPNIKLPTNVIANPSLLDAVSGSSILIFNLPHQFIQRICEQLKGHVVPFARGISCIKGVNVTDDGVALFSEWIGEGLGIYCGALSGANIAPEKICLLSKAILDRNRLSRAMMGSGIIVHTD